MQWQDSDGNDSRVVERGGWSGIGNISNNFPDRAGVYVFANTDLHVKYVGKAGAGRLSVEAVDAVGRGKDRGATRATWLATNSDANALSLESDLINKYDPPNNLT